MVLREAVSTYDTFFCNINNSGTKGSTCLCYEYVKYPLLKFISSAEDIELTPRSPDLTPMDFLWWGYLKSRVDSSHRGLQYIFFK